MDEVRTVGGETLSVVEVDDLSSEEGRSTVQLAVEVWEENVKLHFVTLCV